ncbi:MAG: hypothetical protein IKY28_00960 [Anaerotignum sp.]|nr:hypothetical protein [Anaerotignum sp.]
MKNKKNIAQTIHYLQGRLDGIFMSFHLQKKYLLGTAVVLTTTLFPIYLNYVENTIETKTLLVWLLPLTILLLSLTKALWDYKQKKYHFYSITNPWQKNELLHSLALSKQMQENGYKIEAFFNGEKNEYYVASDLINHQLQNGKIYTFHTLKKQFRIGQELSDMMPSILNEIFMNNKSTLFNGTLLRLAQELYLDRNSVYLQKTHYFDSQCTNEIVYKKYRSANQMFFVFDGAELFVKKEENSSILFDLDESPCSNQIGVSTLAITNDNYVVIGRQSITSKANSGRYAPSGSGSSEFTDIQGCTTLNEVLIKGMERELIEELNFPTNTSLHTILLGYVRLLERGGKPDFFGITYIDASKKELENLEIRLMERDLQDKFEFLPFDDIENLPVVLREFCKTYICEKRISIQVYLLTLFLEELQKRSQLTDYYFRLKNK